jgi:OFA family oxalate/formate antiporter-like MFS transporter
MLYTAKGTASLLVPIASIVASYYGWQAVFVIVVALNATAALLALFIIRPMRRTFILDSEPVTSASPVGRAVKAGAEV